MPLISFTVNGQAIPLPPPPPGPTVNIVITTSPNGDVRIAMDSTVVPVVTLDGTLVEVPQG